MKRIFFSSLLLGLTLMGHSQKMEVLPTAKQQEWIQNEIGVIIHLDINIFAPETFNYEKKETLPPLTAFNPSKLNTDQWVLAAKAAGAKYAVLTAKHGTGFCLWNTKVHSYHTGNTPLHKDVLAAFIKSCKKYGIKPGIYYNTNMNTYYDAGYKEMSLTDRLKYNEAVYQQLEELWSEYGSLYEIWFDGGIMSDKKTGIADKVKTLLKKYQPNACLFQGPPGMNNILRWVENEDGRTPYPFWSRINSVINKNGQEEIVNGKGDPNGKYWVSAEADFPNRNKNAWNGGWLWRANEEQHIFSANELMSRYYTSVGNNTNMLIGMGIDTSGQFPAADAKVFAAFGEKLNKRKQATIDSVNGVGNTHTIHFKKPTKINEIEISEDISKGENINGYIIEVLQKNNWTKVAEGISVGNKRIQQFNTVEVAACRLTITSSFKKPIIKSFKALHYDPYKKNEDYILIQKEERRNDTTKWQLVWEDNFNKGVLDTNYWSKIDLFTTPKWKTPKEKWREVTGCFRYITSADDRVINFDKENIYLNGIVNNDTVNGDPRPMLTGGIFSWNKFAFQYGRIEIKAKLDSAYGSWPAIWMMSEKDIYPNQHNGEMDIMEKLNHDAFAYQTTHNHYTINLKQEIPKKYNTGKINTNDYNIYSVSWYPDKLVYAINGIETITYPKVPGAGTYQWPFDQPFYLIIDQQLEGSWPGKVTNPKELPTRMVVDWVKLYQ